MVGQEDLEGEQAKVLYKRSGTAVLNQQTESATLTRKHAGNNSNIIKSTITSLFPRKLSNCGSNREPNSP